MKRELERISPLEAKEMFLRERQTEVSAATLKANKYRVGHFVRWCKSEAIDDLNELSGRDLHRFRLWRREEGDLNRVSLKTQMDTVRVFIRFCERIDAVRADLHTTVVSPSLARNEDQRDVMLESDTAEEILSHLRRFDYASRGHIIMALLWHTGMRTGSLRALDVEDYHEEGEYVEVRHRPETDTPLKNKAEGERLVALSPSVCEVLDDWIETTRPDTRDEYGRNPFVSTTHGRAHTTTIRETVYRLTRPCVFAEGCPHDRSPESCESTNDAEQKASACPSTVSPHAIRRGSITHFLTNDVPNKVVSDRMNVCSSVLEKHYDQRSESVKMEQRREFIE